MPRARLDITLPEETWIHTVSTHYPDAEFRVLSVLTGEESGVGLLEITADDLPGVLADLEAADGIESLDVLQTSEEEALVQFETDEPMVLLNARATGVPFELPIVIENGHVTVGLTAPRERLSALGERLEAFGISFDVEYVRRITDSAPLLSERQERLLETAVEAGYYDTPRECTLTELAEHEGIAKSTASETLHRAEEKVIKEYVEGA